MYSLNTDIHKGIHQVFKRKKQETKKEEKGEEEEEKDCNAEKVWDWSSRD